uniref:Zinc finger protein n=1 Tax=Panagrellus redivivus TaxID=6233 RepID=A0A7E4ZV74_PANRE
MIHSCDVNDLIDIRFYENRNNGQSKGFARNPPSRPSRTSFLPNPSMAKSSSQPPPLRSALGPPPNVMPTMNLSMNMNMGGGMPNYLRGPPPNMGNPMMRPQNNYNQPPPNMPNMMNPPPLMQGGQNPMGMQMDEEAACGDDDCTEGVKTEAEVVQEEEKIAAQF